MGFSCFFLQALYYLALGYFNTGKLDEALSLTEKGIGRRPGCPEFAELYAKLSELHKKAQEREKMFCRRMFASSTRPPTGVDSDRWSLVTGEVRRHVLEEISALKTNPSWVEVPLKFGLFLDKLNLAYAQEQAAQAGFHVSVRPGKHRNIVRLTRCLQD